MSGVLRRALDHSYSSVVRDHVTLLTVARLTANSAYRFAPPFIATIARDTGVSIVTVGVALTVSELGGLLSPFLGRLIDGWHRRGTMSIGLTGVSLSSFAVAASPGTPTFALALLGIGISKTVFDIALAGWIADHVAYDRRARVVGLTELSWAGGLLIGVPIMGIVAAATSWRGGYVVAAIGVMVLAGVVAKRLADTAAPPVEPPEQPVAARSEDGSEDGSPVRPDRSRRRLLTVVASFGCLMGAAQCAFVTFGSWLEDSFDATATGLAAVSFGLGVGELVASSSTVRVTDRWGKRRSVAIGAALMIPAGVLMTTAAHEHLVTGLAVLGVYIVGFEFAVVSGLSLASNLVPGRPGTGVGFMFGAGTLGRALTNVAATKLYELHGIVGPFVLGSALAAACVALVVSSGSAPQPVAPGARSAGT